MRDSPTPDTFGIDIDALDVTVGEMQRCEGALERLIRDTELEVARLGGLWHGAAADAQRAAQTQWQRGLAEMRAALTAYRLDARRAHDNYVEAAAVNARMWTQTR
jgi:WXG100 family type VII secretion target